MKGLILKDFINLKKNAKIFDVLTVLYAVMAITSRDAEFLSSILTMLFAILTLSIYSYDDLAKWDAYALTMPVSKDDIVRGKYIMMLLLTLIGVVYSSFFTLVINLYLKTDSIFHGFVSIGAGAAIVIIFYSIILPFVTKLGVEKARLVFFAVYIVPFIIVLVINRMAGEGNLAIPENVMQIITNYIKYGYILVPLTAIVFLGISYCISLSLYRKKEF